jgi:hypothetical protein
VGHLVTRRRRQQLQILSPLQRDPRVVKVVLIRMRPVKVLPLVQLLDLPQQA